MKLVFDVLTWSLIGALVGALAASFFGVLCGILEGLIRRDPWLILWATVYFIPRGAVAGALVMGFGCLFDDEEFTDVSNVVPKE